MAQTKAQIITELLEEYRKELSACTLAELISHQRTAKEAQQALDKGDFNFKVYYPEGKE